MNAQWLRTPLAPFLLPLRKLQHAHAAVIPICLHLRPICQPAVQRAFRLPLHTHRTWHAHCRQAIRHVGQRNGSVPKGLQGGKGRQYKSKLRAQTVRMPAHRAALARQPAARRDCMGSTAACSHAQAPFRGAMRHGQHGRGGSHPVRVPAELASWPGLC